MQQQLHNASCISLLGDSHDIYCKVCISYCYIFTEESALEKIVNVFTQFFLLITLGLQCKDVQRTGPPFWSLLHWLTCQNNSMETIHLGLKCDFVSQWQRYHATQSMTLVTSWSMGRQWTTALLKELVTWFRKAFHLCMQCRHAFHTMYRTCCSMGKKNLI